MDLDRIYAPVAEGMKAVDRVLAALVKDVAGEVGRRRVGILEAIVRHPFAVPGKRIRPALVLLSARAAGGNDGRDTRDALASLAAAVEVLHAASLVHDDVIDHADARRHQVSLNKRFGNRVAVLAGDILYTHFFSVLTGLTRVEPAMRFSLLDMFLETTRTMCLGEILAQEAKAVPGPMGFGDYLTIASDKTAVLFAACCRGAGLLCGAPETAQRALGDFGLAFGLAFQMADDLADGDTGLDPRVDLPAARAEYALKAAAAAGLLPEGASRDSLLRLVDHVAGREIP